MKPKILLLTPPFTQLNTPYPATAYLKGFLNTLGYESMQCDLGLETTLKLFSVDGLKSVFSVVTDEAELTDNSYRIYTLQDEYLATITPVITFLQNKNPTLAHSICDGTYLPEASRFDNLEDMEWAFGSMGIQDKARHLATLYLEDIGDFIKEVVDANFGFSRYAERLSSTATHFAPIETALQQPNSILMDFLVELLHEKIMDFEPNIVGISVPFPGNLFAALKCGQYIKANFPDIKIVLGGGYANTELRTVADERVFDYLDFVSLDDGEAPFQILLEHLDGKRPITELKRIFTLHNGVVCKFDGAKELDIPQRETGTPDYSDLLLHDYLSVIEVVNPMHRLWSDGRWNKLTLAHGCYWGKCSFCDVTLDYIQRYEPLTATLLCDRIEEIIAQTGQTGFHFVDEAAPPALMRDLAIEIIKRKITITWWTNIRFEKSFSADLCRLLKASGCIAVSGGLEVASDRLLKLMKKGVTVAQVAQVCDNFTKAGIMVHSYLMYGFPTQTAQETINSLEMVRQLFELGIVQSGFWHRLAMTSHSPIGLEPHVYGVERIGPNFGGFADNDLWHNDPKGANHDLFGEGLRKSLFNYMHGVCFEFSLQDWFGFDIPDTTISPQFIEFALEMNTDKQPRKHSRILWINPLPKVELFQDEEGYDMAALTFANKKSSSEIVLDADLGEWLVSILKKAYVKSDESLTFQALKVEFEGLDFGEFEVVFGGELFDGLREFGLLVL
ncbi:MAG: radical SAM protein [Saprospiraceae bacterium]